MTEPIDRYSIAVEAGITSIKRAKPKKCNTLIDFIRTRYPHYDSLLQYATILYDGKCLIDAIEKRRIISVTDASVSVLNNTSAVSWTINKNVETPLAYGLASCPDYITTQDSYGAEMFGIFNILVVMQMVTKYHNINHGELIIACDNDASLLVGTDGLTKVKIDQKYFDLIWAIQDILNTLPITVIAQKVKGRADKENRVLNKYEYLNVQMDKESKSFRRRLETNKLKHSPTHFEHTRYSIWIKNKRVGCDIAGSIQRHIQGNAVKKN